MVLVLQLYTLNEYVYVCAAGAKKLTAACTVQRDLTGSLIRCARAQFDHLEISAADLTYYPTRGHPPTRTPHTRHSHTYCLLIYEL